MYYLDSPTKAESRFSSTICRGVQKLPQSAGKTPVIQVVLEAIRSNPSELTAISIRRVIRELERGSDCSKENIRLIQRVMLKNLLNKPLEQVNLSDEIQHQKGAPQKVILFLDIVNSELRLTEEALSEALNSLPEFDATRISLEERIDLIKLIDNTKYPRMSQKLEYRLLDKFICIEDFRSFKTRNKRLDFLGGIFDFSSSWVRVFLLENFDQLGFFEEINAIWSLKEKLNFIEKMERDSKYCMKTLIGNAFYKHFTCFGEIDFELRLAISEKIFSMMGFVEKDFLIEHFYKLGFLEDIRKCKTNEDRFLVMEKIINLGYNSAIGLLGNLDQLEKMDPPDRVRLASKFYRYIDERNSILSQLGFLLDIQSCRNFDARLKFIQELLSEENEWLRESLIAEFSELGFVQDLLECRSEEEFFSQISLIASQLGWGGGALIEHAEKVRLERIGSERLVDLMIFIAQQDVDSACIVLDNLEKFSMTRFQMKKRLELANTYAKHRDSSLGKLSDHFEDLGFLQDLKNVPIPEERIDAAINFLEEGLWVSLAILKNLENLDLKTADFEKRMHLARQIAVRAGVRAEMLLGDQLEHLGFIDDLIDLRSSKERIAQALLFVEKEVFTALCVVKNLEQLDFEGTDPEERLSLAKQIASKGIQAAQEVVSQFDCFDLERDLPLERILSIVPILRKNRQLRFFVDQGRLTVKNYRQTLLEAYSTPGFHSYTIRGDISVILKVLKITSTTPGNAKAIEEFLDFTPFKDLFEEPIRKVIFKTKEGDKKYVSQELYRFFAYTSGVCYDLEEEKVEMLMSNPKWILSILDYHRPSLRYPLMRQLSYLSLEALAAPSPISSVRIRPWILLSRLEALGILTSKEKEKAFAAIRKDDFFKDTSRQIALYDLLLGIIEAFPFDSEEIFLTNRVIKELFPENLSRAELGLTMSKLRSLNHILHIFGRDAFFYALRQREISTYQEVFMERFKELFLGLEEVSDLEESFEKTFGRFRDPGALFTYLSRLKQLPLEEETAAIECLSEYVKAVLTGSFHELRYALEGSPHLKKLASFDPMILERWKGSQEPRSLTLGDKGSKSEKLDFKHYFKEKIVLDGHLTPITSYPVLRDYLKGIKGRNFLVEIEGQIEKDPENPLFLFQKLLIELCEGLKSFSEFMESRSSFHLGELENDIQAISLRSIHQSERQVQISETDDPCDLLLIGTEIQESCQRVDGSSKLNKGLLGYLVNGEIKAVVLKDALGKIIARSIIRLLWNGAEPILLQERIYANLEDQGINKAITDRVIEKARSMRVSLISKGVGSGEVCEDKVEFLGGKAPFVYCDAVRSVEKGAFEITDCHFLYKELEIEPEQCAVS